MVSGCEKTTTPAPDAIAVNLAQMRYALRQCSREPRADFFRDRRMPMRPSRPSAVPNCTSVEGSGTEMAAKRPPLSELSPVVKYKTSGLPPLPPLPKVSAHSPWKLGSLSSVSRNAPVVGL